MKKTYKLIDKEGFFSEHPNNRTLFKTHFTSNDMVTLDNVIIRPDGTTKIGEIGGNRVIGSDEWHYFKEVGIEAVKLTGFENTYVRPLEEEHLKAFLTAAKESGAKWNCCMVTQPSYDYIREEGYVIFTDDSLTMSLRVLNETKGGKEIEFKYKYNFTWALVEPLPEFTKVGGKRYNTKVLMKLIEKNDLPTE